MHYTQRRVVAGFLEMIYEKFEIIVDIAGNRCYNTKKTENFNRGYKK